MRRATGSAESERGYKSSQSTVELRTPIMPSDSRMANTTTRAGLRISGQVELASVDAEPTARADVLLRRQATYPLADADLVDR
jgi:D-amino-acid dehydrogenase